MNLPLWLQLAANLLSLGVALVMGWPPGQILLLYWAENVVVAFWQVPRILLAGGPPSPRGPAEGKRPLPRPANLPVALFFLVHYGLFTFVHGVFVFQLFLHQELTAESLRAHLGSGAMMLAVAGLMISHGMAFIEDLGSGRLARTAPGRVMSEPYHRIVVLHLVVLGSAFALTLLPDPRVAVVLLALVKSAIDYRQWRRKPEAETDKEQADVARIP